MKKNILLSLVLLVGGVVALFGQGAPMPVCQPGHCNPAVSLLAHKCANSVRKVFGKGELPCFVPTATPSQSGPPPQRPDC